MITQSHDGHDGLYSAVRATITLPPLPSGASDDFDLLAWLKAQSTEAYEAGLLATWETWEAIPYPMRTPRCISQSVSVFLDYATRNSVQKASITNHRLPLPLFTLGHLIAVGHYNPDQFSAIPFLPADLTIHVLISKADYDGARADFLDQFSVLFDDGFNGDAIEEHEPFSALEGCSKGDTAREALRWVMRLPTVPLGDASTLQVTLTKAGDVDLTRLPSEYFASIDRILTGTLAIRTDLFQPDRDIAGRLGVSNLSAIGAYPIFMSDTLLWVVTDDPKNYRVEDKLCSITKQRVIKIRCSQSEVQRLLQGEQQVRVTTTSSGSGAIAVASESRAAFAIDPREFEKPSQNAFEDIGYLMKYILCEAMRRGASDIHIDQFNGEARVRCEVDGFCVALLTQPGAKKGPIMSKIKQFADIRLDGKEPSEGYFTFAFQGRDIDVRVALAYSHGSDPKFTLRLLDKTLALRSLTDLGLASTDIKKLREFVSRKQGIILTSGPTGAGKSTTMAALVMEVNSPDRVIYTLEDPIEYVLPGVTQLLVSGDPSRASSIRPTFADGVKLLLRHAPKIILVGEIRDAATASASAELSMTGHLVISTVHANDVFTVINRLRGKNVDSRDLADGLRLITSQRLIRRLCKCHRRRDADLATMKLFENKGITLPAGRQLIGSPIGCAECNFTGYRGRMCVMESLEITSSLRDMIADGEKTSALRSQAEAHGYVPLFTQGLHKVMAGLTSLDEVRHHIEE